MRTVMGMVTQDEVIVAMQPYLNRTWVNKAAQINRPCSVKFVVHQYDSSDNEIGQYDEYSLFECPNYKDYYYRVDPYTDTPRGKATDLHFGVSVSNEGSNEFDIGIDTNQRLNYIISLCSSPTMLLDTINKSLNASFRKFKELASLDHDELEKALNRFLKRYPNFTEVNVLSEVKNKTGLYLMVLDEYNCCYIGQAQNIKIRIQQHWRKTNFGTSGIDMFKALDTTRIFAVCLDDDTPQRKIDHMEYQFIHSINRDYLLNCWGGGGSMEFIHSDASFMGYGSDPV